MERGEDLVGVLVAVCLDAEMILVSSGGERTVATADFFIAGMVTAMLIDYHVFARFTAHLYIANVVLLLIVLRFAHNINGALFQIVSG